MKIALHWFRCDLRLSDNTALHAATKAADVVVPVFIFDPRILKAPETGAPIVGFMLESLDSLAKNIEAAGGKLIFRHGEVEAEMNRAHARAMLLWKNWPAPSASRCMVSRTACSMSRRRF
jgi:deoxyribodipyrimidine photo-lyase